MQIKEEYTKNLSFIVLLLCYVVYVNYNNSILLTKYL